MAKNEDVRRALERELEFYERADDEKRADEVREQIKRLRSRSRRPDVERAVESPLEDAAERTGGVTTDDLGALAKQPARSRSRRGK